MTCGRSLRRAALTFAAGGFAQFGFTCDQEFSQHMKVAPQDAERDVTLQAHLGAVTGTVQPVCWLERPDRGLHAGVALTRLSEGNRRCAFLFCRLLGAWLGKARLLNEGGQQALVLGRVAAAIKRDS